MFTFECDPNDGEDPARIQLVAIGMDPEKVILELYFIPSKITGDEDNDEE